MAPRGRILYQTPLKKMTWMGVGGPAQQLFFPANEEDLSLFIRSHEEGSLYILGAGSNLLVRDGPLEGTVIKIGKGFQSLTIHDSFIEVGAGLLDRTVAYHCLEAGLSGFEFLFTIPGTIGGALAMNAGCYGTEIVERLEWVDVMDPQGIIHRLSPEEVGYSHRRSHLPQGWIFLKARMKGTLGNKEGIAHTMNSFFLKREESQPTCVKTSGSTFLNTSDHKAWTLLDQAGYRGCRKGEAQFSEKHCNFLINHGHASAVDLEDLAEEARQAVLERTGISLQWEVIRWGTRYENMSSFSS